MRYPHSLFYGISSANLVGNLPFFVVDCFVRWHMFHSMTSSWTIFLIPGHYKCWIIINSVLSNHGWGTYLWYYLTTYLWTNCGINILALNVTRFIVFWNLWKEPLIYSAESSFSVRMGSSEWYQSMSLKDRGNAPYGNSLMLYSSDIVFVVYVHSCVVFCFTLSGNCDSASAAIFFLPGIYLISRPYSSHISLHRNTL